MNKKHSQEPKIVGYAEDFSTIFAEGVGQVKIGRHISKLHLVMERDGNFAHSTDLVMPTPSLVGFVIGSMESLLEHDENVGELRSKFDELLARIRSKSE